MRVRMNNPGSARCGAPTSCGSVLASGVLAPEQLQLPMNACSKKRCRPSCRLPKLAPPESNGSPPGSEVATLSLRCDSKTALRVCGLSLCQERREFMHAQSPVDVVIAIRKELAEFQRTSSQQELLAALKVVCRAALPCRGHDRGSPGSSRV